MKERYLITAIGGDIGSSVVRCLNKEFPKICLLGCDITPYIPSYDEVGIFFLVPPYNDEEIYAKFILNKCKKYEITHILPMTEGEIRVFDKYREDFYKRNIKIMIQNSNVLQVAFSKFETAKAVKEMGLKSPKTWTVNKFIESPRFPIVIKPNQGCGSKNVRIAYNIEEYETFVSGIPDAVIQEYVGDPDHEYTVGVFSKGEKVNVIIFKRKLDVNGMSRLVEQIEDENITIISKTIARHFDLHGSINIQLRTQGKDYYIFEINPRISSTVGFRYMLGFKDIKWWLDLLDGDKSEINYTPENLPVIGIRTYQEKIFRNQLAKEIKHQ